MSLSSGLIIGLGKTGIKALNEIALYAGQTYGDSVAESLALLGLDFETPATLNPLVRYYGLHTDISDWLVTRKTLESHPVLRSWFDIPYYSGKTDPHLPMKERQLGRLMFLRGLDEHVTKLDTLLWNLLQPLPKNSDSFTVYVLMSLSDGVISAVLMDILNFVSRALERLHLEKAPLVIHLALPSVSPYEQRMERARCFAVLRELEHFTVSYRDTLHIIYPADSGWEKLNTRLKMENLKIYPSQSEDDLAALWSDILLPQLSSEGFGNHYRQYYINNSTQQRLQQAEATGNPYGLYAGTYDVRSAIFPLEIVRHFWTTRLAFEILNAWIGDAHPPEMMRSLRDVQWINQVYQTSDGESVSCPKIVDWLVNLKPAQASRLTADYLIYPLFEAERDHALINAVRENYRSVLDWLPQAEALPQQSVPDFTQTVEREIVRHLGKPNGKHADEHPALYQDALTAIADQHKKRFKSSLEMFVEYLLNDEPGGLKNTLILVETLISKPLNAACDHLQKAQRDSLKQLRVEDWRETLDRSGRQIHQIKTRLSGQTAEVKNYLELAQSITRQRKSELALAAVIDIALYCRDVTAQIVVFLKDWSATLWQEEDSFLELAERDIQVKPELTETPYRFWLMEDEWVQQMYNRVAAQTRESLRENFHWQMTLENGISLFAGQHEISPENRQVNHDDWLNHVSQVVQTIPFDLLSDYLLPDDHYYLLLPRLQSFFAGEEKRWILKAFKESDFLLFPPQVNNEGKSIIVTPLQNYLTHANVRLDVKDDGLTNEDATRFVRYLAFEAFPVFQLPEYEQARKDYLALDRQQRARLHVLPTEVEAVHLEAQAVEQLGIQVMLTGKIISLLNDMERVRLFVRLDALGFMQNTEYDFNKHLKRYVLTLNANSWWLAEPGAGQLEAITDFVFQQGQVAFGQPPYESFRAIPYEMLEKYIGEVVEARTHSRKQSYDDKPLNRYLSVLKKNAKQGQRARMLAEEADALFLYKRETREKLQVAQNREEHDLLILLTLIASQFYDERLTEIRSGIH